MREPIRFLSGSFSRARVGVSLLLAFLILAALPSPARAGEYRVALGVMGVSAGWRADKSPWLFSLRYSHWTDRYDDPFTGNPLTDDTYTLVGPQVCYLFTPEEKGSWYVGASVKRWTLTEKALMTGASDTSTKTAPFFGGGFEYRFAGQVYVNVGLFISGATMKVETPDSSTEENGMDGQLELGIAF